MQIDELKEKTSDLAGHVEDLANTFYKLTVLNVTQKTSNLVAGMVVGIVIGVLGIFILLFLGIALAWWLGDVLENRTAGFLLGAGFFLVMLLLVFLFRKKIISPIRNLVIRKIYD